MRRCIQLAACLALALLSTSVDALECPLVDKDGTALSDSGLGADPATGAIALLCTYPSAGECPYAANDQGLLINGSPSKCPDALAESASTSSTTSTTTSQPASTRNSTLSQTPTPTSPSTGPLSSTNRSPSSGSAASTITTPTSAASPSSTSGITLDQNISSQRKGLPPAAITGVVLGVSVPVVVLLLLLWL
ncbi:hypothetical protein DFH09DRAFT_1146668 [Mycena vulgaris]|nr:hypothetical protein DFH09DRAFT_1146668 [Mycena vulgaris]